MQDGVSANNTQYRSSVVITKQRPRTIIRSEAEVLLPVAPSVFGAMLSCLIYSHRTSRCKRLFLTTTHDNDVGIRCVFVCVCGGGGDSPVACFVEEYEKLSPLWIFTSKVLR